MTVAVRPVASRRDRRLFRDLPAALHGRDPAFVPMLDVALAAVLDRGRNPFWRHAEGREWLARCGREVVGRIGACVDRKLAERAPGCGAIGFFDCENRRDASTALFATAERWLAERGCTRGRGPLNYSIHDTAGLLVEGFETPPAVDTTWNPPYYAEAWEAHGWRGVQDMLGAAGRVLIGGTERVHRFAERARRQGVAVRPIDLSSFDDEVERVRRIFNAAWEDNWGHVPIGKDEFAYKAKDMKAVLDPRLVNIAELDGEPVGVFLGLPDLNVAIKRSRGRLLPLGWLRLLRAKRRAGRCRVMLLGVVPGRRSRGVVALLMSKSYETIGSAYPWSEASWVLEDNLPMVNSLKEFGMFPYKKWRMYEKSLGA